MWGREDSEEWTVEKTNWILMAVFAWGMFKRHDSNFKKTEGNCKMSLKHRPLPLRSIASRQAAVLYHQPYISPPFHNQVTDSGTRASES